MVKHIKSNEEFESEVVKSEIPVIIDFYAEWCGPCRIIAPLIEKLSEDYKDKVKFIKVNVDEAQELAVKFNVMSIPTILLVKDGEVVDQKMGAMPEFTFKEWIDSNI